MRVISAATGATLRHPVEILADAYTAYAGPGPGEADGSGRASRSARASASTKSSASGQAVSPPEAG